LAPVEDLYKEVILDHYKSPRNKRQLSDPDVSSSKNNPLCGDEITILAHLEDGTVTEVVFLGSGCSISQASASMMTEAVQGKRVDEAKGLAEEFRGMMEGARDPDEDQFGDLMALKGVAKYPVRIKCAVLAWDVLQDALSGPSGSSAAGSRTD
jgi:nitrogen fixation protein NifU and related proteins